MFFDGSFFILQISNFLVVLFFINVGLLLDLIKLNLKRPQRTRFKLKFLFQSFNFFFKPFVLNFQHSRWTELGDFLKIFGGFEFF